MILCGFLIGITTYAQDESIQPPPEIPAGIDMDNIDPQDIPSVEELRKMGATDAEIEEIEALRNRQVNEAAEKGEDATDTEESAEETVDENITEKEAEVANVGLERKFPPATVYGQEIFRNSDLKFFEKSTYVKVPDNYILGPGDEISISIWGFNDFEGVFKIDPSGAIDHEPIGRIFLRDKTMADARNLIRQRFGSIYNLQRSKFDITLTYSRNNTINIVGEVFLPGSYSISAINTAFNALISSGGPNDIGSLRKIAIKREGRTIRTLDVYQFLQNPEAGQDFFLQNNDFIQVLPIGKVVKIEGQVRRNHRYELLDKEHLIQLIKYAGGLTATAFTKNIQVTRYQNNAEIQIDIDLDSLMRHKKDFPLFDGDIVNIREIPKGVTNIIEIIGAVKFPGNYEIRKGERISDLIARAEGVTYDCYLDEALLIRLQEDMTFKYFRVNLGKLLNNPKDPDNLVMQKLDKLRVYSKTFFMDYNNVSIEGEVRNPGTHPYGEDMNLKKLIQLGGGLKESAFLNKAYIIGEREDSTSVYRNVRLDTANNFAALENIRLNPRDKVRILSKSYFKDYFKVAVYGEVHEEQEFEYDESLTLADVLMMSGGFKFSAAPNKVEVSRIMERDPSGMGRNRFKVENIELEIQPDILGDARATGFILEPSDQIFVRRAPEYEKLRIVTINGEVTYPGVYNLSRSDEKLLDLIERAGGFTPFAFKEGATFYRNTDSLEKVVLDLKRVVKHKKSSMNYTLEAGDVINIPRINELIRLKGAIEVGGENGLLVPFHKGKSAGFYIRNYGGGFKKEARRKKTFVSGPNGRVKRTYGFLGIKFYPKVAKGSDVLVMNKQSKEKDKEEKDPVDWNGVIEKTTAQVVGILTLTLLLTRIIQ